MDFKDRVANKPNRVKLTYEDSGASAYATVELADEPIESGTPLNKVTFDEMQEELKSYAYAVGNVLITSTNENPSEKLGGIWELIDKEFKHISGSDAFIPINGMEINTSGSPWVLYTDVAKDGVIDYVRSGHGIYIRFSFTANGDLDSKENPTLGNKIIGAINWSKIGVTAPVFAKYMLGGFGATFVKFFTYSSKYISVAGVSGNGIIPDGTRCVVEFTETTMPNYMLDSACDKFYWKRIA